VKQSKQRYILIYNTLIWLLITRHRISLRVPSRRYCTRTSRTLPPRTIMNYPTFIHQTVQYLYQHSTRSCTSYLATVLCSYTLPGTNRRIHKQIHTHTHTTMPACHGYAVSEYASKLHQQMTIPPARSAQVDCALFSLQAVDLWEIFTHPILSKPTCTVVVQRLHCCCVLRTCTPELPPPSLSRPHVARYPTAS